MGVTNWAPPAVSTQRTLPPAFRISRISSHALYAAIPPPTMRRIRLSFTGQPVSSMTLL